MEQKENRICSCIVYPRKSRQNDGRITTSVGKWECLQCHRSTGRRSTSTSTLRCWEPAPSEQQDLKAQPRERGLAHPRLGTGSTACPLQVLFSDLAIYLLGSENGKMTVPSWEDQEASGMPKVTEGRRILTRHHCCFWDSQMCTFKVSHHTHQGCPVRNL